MFSLGDTQALVIIEDSGKKNESAEKKVR
jgi:hypothetical protein